MKTTTHSIIRGLIMILITTALTGCQSNKTGSITEKDKTFITGWNTETLTMGRNLNKDNAEAFVKHTYSEDAILFPPNAKSVKGREAIILFYQNYPPMSDFNQEIEEMEVLGDYAYLRLNWSIPVAQTELNPSYTETGIIFCVMRRQNDGNWKIWREIWNSDMLASTTPASDTHSTK